MESTFLKIRDGLLELFPDAQNMGIRPDTLLQDLPEWDSMSAVNFQLFIKKEFDEELPPYLLCNESTTVDDVAYHLEMVPA